MVVTGPKKPPIGPLFNSFEELNTNGFSPIACDMIDASPLVLIIYRDIINASQIRVTIVVLSSFVLAGI